MINTNSRDLDEVRQIGNKIKKEVNKLYRLLEIEIDGVFKTMLLLKKKKYAALVVNNDAATGQITTTRELKGIDMVRRDWCPLSKEIGSKVLDFIMDGKLSRDDVVESIHHHVAQQAKAIRAGKVKIGKFIITKGLNKHPHLYPNASSQPHLVVALAQIAKGRTVNPGDHIPYVVFERGVRARSARISLFIHSLRGLLSLASRSHTRTPTLEHQHSNTNSNTDTSSAKKPRKV